jgi:hypothetical protein
MGSNNYDGQTVNISNVHHELTEYLQVLLVFPVMVFHTKYAILSSFKPETSNVKCTKSDC